MNEQKEILENIRSEDAVVVMPAADDSPDMIKKKQRPRFLIGLGIYFGIMLVIIGIALFFLNTFLTNYEAATPNAALNQYKEWVRQKDYEAIYKSSGFEETTLNTKDEYLQYLERLYGGDPKEITLRERISTDDTVKQYSLYYDEERVSILVLTQNSDHSGWQVTTQLVYQEPFTIYAGTETRITINGEDIGLLGITTESAQETIFTGTENTTIYPAVNRYVLKDLLNPPEIEALTLSGESCTVLQDENDPYIFRIIHSPSEEEQKTQEELAKTVATTYAAFVARDASRTTLLKYVYKNSSFYQAIRNFSNSWFTAHESYEFKNVELINDIRYTDADFTCEVKFQPIYVRNGKNFEGEPAHYRMTFLKTENEWLLLSLTPVADDIIDSDNGTIDTNPSSTSTDTNTTA